MKGFLLLCFLWLGFIENSFSQKDNVNLEISGGAYLNKIYQGRLGLDFTKGNNSFGMYGDIFIHSKSGDLDFLIGGVKNLVILRSERILLKVPLGGSFGVETDSFVFAFNSGLSIDLYLNESLILNVSQNNQYAINSVDQLRFGITTGIKFPFN